MNGYSDRVNHALAFAAKHHDRQVRKGLRLPYVTHAANVAVILTRYDQDEATVVAGILQDVVEDYVRDGWTRAMLDERLAEKFGTAAVSSAVAASRRRSDDAGNELSRDERAADYLERLTAADDRARWVCAADALHTGNAMLAELRRTVDAGAVWGKSAGGRAAFVDWYRAVLSRLEAAGFDAPIVTELRATVAELERAPDTTDPTKAG